MSKITIGKAGRHKAQIDLDILLRTRLLLQANSGGGKSWALRRIAEQAFGKVPVIIIDPDGEFATLRERHGYVLVGKGGETPADPRSASLVAQKLLEARASAVCDLYEMKVSERHRWVKSFLEAIVDAPKKLWRPLLVIVDEAHMFCPEKGAGESEAADAMIGLATRGRKRGFCAAFATQRLGKLRKDAAAELLNIMIGPTFIDIDRKRAAEALGVHGSKDQHKFFDQVKVLEPGNFYALGRAISRDRLLVRVGRVNTTHPEPGSSKHSAAPPPTPQQVKRLLPKLKDLPKAAELKARTIVDLRREIRFLKSQLRAKPKPAKVAKPVVDVSAIKKALLARDEEWVANILVFQKRLDAEIATLPKTATALLAKVVPKKATPKALDRWAHRFRQIAPVAVAAATTPIARTPAPSASGNGELADLSNPQQSIMRSLAEFDSIGRTDVPRTWIAVRVGASHRSSSFKNNISGLRSRKLLDYGNGKTIHFTDEGRSATPACDKPLDNEEMFRQCISMVSKPQSAILNVVYEAHPEYVSREDIADKCGVSVASSSFKNNISALRSAGMMEYGDNRTVKCADWLFIE